jgi:hypothetical protein
MPRVYTLLALLLLFPVSAMADPAGDASQCKQGAGSFLAGTVTRGPHFQSGKPLHGVYLSHTHLTLKGDDGTSYDVAIDNVFASGYRRNQPSVPAPLNTIQTGDRLELCGQLYSGGDVGIHWVHTNCGETPTSDKPDGWVRKLNSDGSAGDNMESNQAFCSLWPG